MVGGAPLTHPTTCAIVVSEVRRTTGDGMERIQHARLSDETFDEFLAVESMLAACEKHAIEEIIADRFAEAMKRLNLTKAP